MEHKELFKECGKLALRVLELVGLIAFLVFLIIKLIGG